jgi:hypothetical protein
LEINEIISSGLLELYVAGLAAEAESRQVEQWAAQYPAVKHELNAIETALESYAIANAAQPAAGVKARLMAEITSGKVADIAANGAAVVSIAPAARAKKTPVAAMWKRLAAASVVLLAGSAIFSMLLLSKNKTKEKELAVAKTEVNNAQAALQKIQQAHLVAHHDMEEMLSGSVVKIALQKTANAPDGCTAAIYWNKKTGEVYIDPCRMTKAPGGKTYQLWAIVNGKPVDAGIVKTGTSEEKYSIQKMKIFEKAEGFAVTLEKEGGSPVPTPDQTYVTGKVA